MRRLVTLMIIMLATASAASAQVIQPPRIVLAWDYDADYDKTYPPGTFGAEATSYVKEYRVEITKNGDSKPSVTINIPRAQVVRNEGTLTASAVPALFGSTTVTVRTVTREDMVSGPSNVVPFVGAGPTPALVRNLRVDSVVP